MTQTKLPRVIHLPDGPVASRARRPSKKALVAIGGAMLALAGCTTFGTNIKGSFACGAPGQGTCAPATVIDDRALAEITGDASYLPAGPYRPMPRDVTGRAAMADAAPAGGQVVPAGQKVLRIVFPAHVDGAGRYHETSVVKAVVDNGAWMQASAGHGAGLAQTVNLTVNPEILAQLTDENTSAREQVDVSKSEQLSLADPNSPSAEAVAAARARGAARAAQTEAQEAAGTKAAANRPASFSAHVED